MPTLGLKFFSAPGQGIKNGKEYERIIAKASTAAIKEATKQGLAAAKTEVASAGFGGPTQRAMRSKMFPPRGISLNPVGYIHSTINFLDIFEKGGTIHGTPFLWLPLPAVPKYPGTGRGRFPARQMTPSVFIARVGPLVTIKRPGKLPMLGTPDRGKTARTRRKKLAKEVLGGKKPPIVPMFVAVRSVTIPDLLDVREEIAKHTTNISELYQRNLDAYEGRK